MLYSYKGAYPTQLPNKIILSSGLSRTDRTTFTPEEIADAGWVAVDYPPEVSYPNKLEWDGTSWVVRPPNDSETKIKQQEIRDWCQRKLNESDYRVIKALESGIPLDAVYVTYRQELRDLYNNIINIDPWNINFPYPIVTDDE